jgi:hypothetical protein
MSSNARDRRKAHKTTIREDGAPNESNQMPVTQPPPPKSTNPSKPSPRVKPKLLPFFQWLRSASIAAELFGWGGLLLTGWFWSGVDFIYGGFFLLAVDLWVEPRLHRKSALRASGVLAIAILAASFSWGIVFVNAPLPISTFVTNAEYPAGTSIAGISWKPQFTELQVWIDNPTERNYEDLNLVIRPLLPVAAIAQLTDVPNVSFEDGRGEVGRLTEKSTVIPLVLLATDAGYRMRCPHLPARTEIKVVLAIAEVKWNPSPPGSGKITDEDYVLRHKNDDFSTYWYGHTGADDYTPRITSSEDVKIEGEYTVGPRTRSLSVWVPVGATGNR